MKKSSNTEKVLFKENVKGSQVVGKKGKLPTAHEKLTFLLYYLKVYPTFDVLGTQFGLNRSKACGMRINQKSG